MMDSKDIFYIVLAFCALWFTAFLCFALYHVAAFMKRMQDLSSHAKEKFDEAMETVRVIRMKVEGHVNAITSIGDGIRKVMEALRSRND
jgi:translation initiation factor 2 alpha subunit (eIF-2alpha)